MEWSQKSKEQRLAPVVNPWDRMSINSQSIISTTTMTCDLGQWATSDTLVKRLHVCVAGFCWLVTLTLTLTSHTSISCKLVKAGQRDKIRPVVGLAPVLEVDQAIKHMLFNWIIRWPESDYKAVVHWPQRSNSLWNPLTRLELRHSNTIMPKLEFGIQEGNRRKVIRAESKDIL